MINKQKTFLFVFAHPDDETSSSGGTITKLSKDGHSVYVCTATRGELGTLGTGTLKISRKELPKVREKELSGALKLFGAHPAILLGYKDQELQLIPEKTLIKDISKIIHSINPNFIITFGPSGISGHSDHIAISRSTTAAFKSYLKINPTCKLFYVAISKEASISFNLKLTGLEMNPNVIIDISKQFQTKLNALKNYRSQEDAQSLAKMFEQNQMTTETFVLWNRNNATQISDSF